MLALSTCWHNHRHSDGLALAEEARALGFEWIEISHGTKLSLLPGLIAAVEQRVIRVSSLHNFCPAPVEVLMDAPDVYEFSSDDASERGRALKLTRKTIEMAARLNADRIVLHLGTVRTSPATQRLEKLAEQGGLFSRPYTELKLDLVARRTKSAERFFNRAREALEHLLPLAEEHQVRLGIETRSHFEQVPCEDEILILLGHFRNSEWIGAWHDFGHVQRQANLGFTNHAQYLRRIAPRVIGCHIHDVQWPARDHRVPLITGGVAFADLLPLVPRTIPWVWELSPSQRVEDVQAALPRWHELVAALPGPPMV